MKAPAHQTPKRPMHEVPHLSRASVRCRGFAPDNSPAGEATFKKGIPLLRLRRISVWGIRVDYGSSSIETSQNALSLYRS